MISKWSFSIYRLPFKSFPFREIYGYFVETWALDLSEGLAIFGLYLTQAPTNQLFAQLSFV